MELVVFGAIILLSISIVVLSIRYFMAYARLASHKSYDREARREMRARKKADPMITCDYCGTAIDTRRYKVCPNCSASYGQDTEWLERNTIPQDWVEERADVNAEKEINLARTRAKETAKKLRTCIFILLGGLVAFVALAVAAGIIERNSRFATDEELNRYSTDHYESLNLEFENGGVILDTGTVKATVTGIYQNGYNNGIAIEYRLENHSGKKSFFISP